MRGLAGGAGSILTSYRRLKVTPGGAGGALSGAVVSIARSSWITEPPPAGPTRSGRAGGLDVTICYRSPAGPIARRCSRLDADDGRQLDEPGPSPGARPALPGRRP